MIREREHTIENGFLVFEIILTICTLMISYFIGYDIAMPTKDYRIVIATIIPVWYVLLNLSNLSRLHRLKSFSAIFIEYCIIISIGTGVLLFVIFILKLSSISRLVIIVFGFSNLFVLYFTKIGIYYYFKNIRAKGKNSRNLLLIVDESAEKLIDKIIENKFWGYKIKVIITDSQEITDKYSLSYSILPMNTNIDKFIEIETVDEVIYCIKDYKQEEIKQLIYSCEEIGVTFRMQSNLYSMIHSKSTMSFFDEIPFFTFSNSPHRYFDLKIKHIFDYIIAFFALLFASPLMLLVACLIKFNSKGPIFFKQIRVGLRGRKFMVYKFRTMIDHADEMKEKLKDLNEQEGPVFKIKNDPRLTKLGKFLRKSSIDEIPQFINVLKGEMSIVGPRPPVPKEVEQYERWQLRRFSMKPGITCIWQVSGRNKISFQEWMKLDLQYIDTWSIYMDIIIIFKTIRAVFRMDGI